MGRGLRVARVFGIDVVLDPSWFLISFLIAWSFGNVFAQTRGDLGLRGSGYTVMGILAAALFFGSLLAHELSHALVARTKGIEVRAITLFVFGGVAQIKKEPATAGDEFRIAVAGPVMSVVLGGLLIGVGRLAQGAGAGPAAPVGAVFGLVGQLNLILAVFNLLPGFPLDGGRILRAAVWGATGNLLRATRIASLGGQLIAWGLIGLGVFRIYQGQLFGGIWFILIGLFVYQAASAGYQQLVVKRSLGGLRVEDLMTPDPVSISGNTRLDEAVDGYFLRHRHTAFPVLGFAEQVEGLVTLQQIRDSAREQWGELTVRQVMLPLNPSLVARPTEPLATVVDRLAQNPVGRFLVVDGDRLVGILSSSDIARHLQIRASIGMDGRGAGSAV